MSFKTILFILFFAFISVTVTAQTGTIRGIVNVEGEPIEFAQIVVHSTNFGTTTNFQGKCAARGIALGRAESGRVWTWFDRPARAARFGASGGHIFEPKKIGGVP